MKYRVDEVIKNNNKRIKSKLIRVVVSMIKSIRMRPIEKPFITHEIYYNHREEPVDSNSEASFLRISENSSKQLNVDRDPFTALENKLFSVQQRSALRLNQIKIDLARLEDKHISAKAHLSKGIVEENKQNLRMTCRRMPLSDSLSSQFDHCNFEMDENFNYIKKEEVLQRIDSFQSTTKVVVKSKQFYSLENSRLEHQPTKRKIYRRSNSHSGKNSQKNLQTNIKLKINTKSSSVKSVSEQRSQSSGGRFKRGRVYEQILSLYSIPKLLAMQPKGK